MKLVLEHFSSALLCGALLLPSSCAQVPEQKADDALLERLERQSMLTYDGHPFHAVMEISPEATENHPSPGDRYRGRVEVWWAGSGSYRLTAKSPDFNLNRVAVAGQLHDQITGDYYPGWLETFVSLLTDPVPTERFSASAGARLSGGPSGNGMVLQRCFERDDRVDGITDDLTWGHLCFDQSGTRIEYLVTLNRFYALKDWSDFDGKTIARTYQTDVLDRQQVVGHLTTLEPLSATDAALIMPVADSSASPPITTQLVTTRTEESMVEKAPAIPWPPIREGKTDGYMIIDARTDRTGQVRETSPHNSDNPGLEAFGSEQALKYKFKPLIVDGTAVQMEMPLVLHFTSRIDNPIPVLAVDQMKKQIISCHPDPIPGGVLDRTQHAIVRVSVDEAGKVVGSQPVSAAPWGRILGPWMSFKSCRFRPYLTDGKPTFYKGDIELTAR